MPGCKVIFNAVAENDFNRISDYLIDNDFDITIAYQIRAKIMEVLSDRPNSGAIYNESQNIRKILVMRKNTVYYRIFGDTVQVLHIRAGRMDKNIL
jgi:plasmid stabilization system protein ParE